VVTLKIQAVWLYECMFVLGLFCGEENGASEIEDSMIE